MSRLDAQVGDIIDYGPWRSADGVERRWIYMATPYGKGENNAVWLVDGHPCILGSRMNLPTYTVDNAPNEALRQMMKWRLTV